MLTKIRRFLRENQTPILLSFSLIVLISWSLFFSADMRFSRTQLGFTSFFVDSMLTLILIVLYSKIANAQREQTMETANQVNLQEQQAKLMKAQYEPSLVVGGWNIRQHGDETSLLRDPVSVACFNNIDPKYDLDNLHIGLSNFGPGVAKNLQVRWRIQVRVNPEGEGEYAKLEGWLQPAYVPLFDKDTDYRTSLSRRQGGVLPPNGENREFACTIGLTEEPNNLRSDTYPFRLLFQLLANNPEEYSIEQEEDIETIRLEADLLYEDSADNSHRKKGVIFIETELRDTTLAEITEEENLMDWLEYADESSLPTPSYDEEINN
jgi:hypothetical protein